MAGNAQDLLFQRIREILPPHISLVDAISEILHVSNDSAYRRIRGETYLVLEEARLICDHYHLSLDQMFNVQSGSVLFETIRIHNKNYPFDNYLEGILQQLQQVMGFLQKEVIYLTKDIPLFHQFTFQPFFAFRYFFWMKSILQHPDYATRTFSFDCLPPAVKLLGESVVNAYNTIPSTEIWNSECINSTIFQVEYYKEAGIFSSSSDIRMIYDATEEAIYHLKSQVENGCKFLPGENPQLKKNNFKFFHNRIVLGDNMILVITDHQKIVHINFDVLNYISTRDDGFCKDAFDMMQNIIKRSTLLSIVSEKQRNIFFNFLLSKIEDRKRHL